MYPSSRHMTLNICLVIYVIFRIKVSVSGLQGHERSGLVVKILNKCILSILVYILFLDRQRNSVYTPQCFHTPVYLLSSCNRNSYFQKIWLIGPTK